ncbi:hypothetical protein ACFQS1_17170 [Paractinoplanes rhizophilus]|uniref:Polysaccharide chain length determinant N-terminal domain-containing protein n=1 Tax=Paractinoplanes rhizophilus TaxID=1416877 RepID=A0ABW2HRJ9_9ACTN
MDFWDLTKLVFRRWYIAVPLLLATAFAAVYTMNTVQPDYKATAYVQLIPPPEASIAKDIKTLRNPWLDLGLGALNTAATYATVDKRFLNQLKTGGMSDNVVITNGYPAPIATIEVIGSSQAIATGTADAVVKHFNDVVKSLQDDYAVQTPGRILTRRLDTGTNLEETGGKVKRALVAVLGAGVLVTAGLTIALDALMSGRFRRRGKRGETEVDESVAEPVITPTGGPGDRTVKIQVPPQASRQQSAVPAVNGGTPGETNGSKGSVRRTAEHAPTDATIVLPSSVYPKRGDRRDSRR